MRKDKIENLNAFITSIEEKDEADFYTEICDYFDFKQLGNFFELSELIEVYRDCVDVIKTYGSDFQRTIVFLKNIVERRKFNDVQKYNFYLLLYIFFDYIVFENIKKDAEKFQNWISDQITLVNDIAALYYIDYNISTLLKNIAHKSVTEQISILLAQKSEYLLALSQYRLPPNNFDIQCDQQIQVLQMRRSEEQVLPTSGLKELLTVKDVEQNTVNEDSKIKLTLPDFLTDDKFGDVNFAANYTGYSVSTIRRLARTKKIPAYKPTKTGEWRFKSTELDDWKVNGMKNFQEEPDDKLLGKRKKRK
jgi:excisionase family DNA binding protein